MKKRSTSWVLVLTAALVPVLAQPVWAFTFAEIEDAGELPDTAQTVFGEGPVDAITGELLAQRDGTDVDMYRICLIGGGTFSATTVGTPGEVNDTQLFLFDEEGRLVDANDDADATTRRSRLPAVGPGPTSPGVYYLAISAYNVDPVFDPPEGPVSGWEGGAEESGTYTINLTGAFPCPLPVSLCATPPVPGEGAIVGTAVTDIIVGTEGNDVIFARGGQDRVDSLGGDDVIFGGPGNDRLDGGGGDDLICGGEGHDLLLGGGGDDTLSGDPGNDNLRGGEEHDQLYGGPGFDSLNGGSGENSNDGGPNLDFCTNPSSGPGCP